MDMSSMSNNEIIQIYSDSIKELKSRGVLRTNNVIGDLGEYCAIHTFCGRKDLPNLHTVPVGTENINAISQNGDRYAIKSTTGHVTGVFYGLQPKGSEAPDTQRFEYVLICKFDDNCKLKSIWQLDWNTFLKHKRWHSRMKAWNLAVTQALISDATIIYDSEKCPQEFTNQTEACSDIAEPEDDLVRESRYQCMEDDIQTAEQESSGGSETEKVDHHVLKKNAALSIGKFYSLALKRESESRYTANNFAVHICSAGYNTKNKEYWYSITPDNLDWLSLCKSSYMAFVLGTTGVLVMFSLEEIRSMLPYCLTTLAKDGKSVHHYHLSFILRDTNKVFFKQKKPERVLIDVTSSLVDN